MDREKANRKERSMSDEKKEAWPTVADRAVTHQNQSSNKGSATSVSSKISEEDAENHKLGTGRLLDVLQIGDSDILHKVLDKFKDGIRNVHVKCHQDKFGYPSWRNCGKIGCFTNFEAVRQAEILLYGEAQND